MKSKMNLKNGIVLVLGLIALTLILLIWPGRVVQDHVFVQSPDESYDTTETIDVQKAVMQEFVPSYSYVNSIYVMIDSLNQDSGLFYFKFYDNELNLLFETAQRLRMENGQSCLYYQFPIQQEVVQGTPYYYTLEYQDSSFGVCYLQETGLNDNGKLYYALEEVPGTSAVTRYDYREDFSTSEILLRIFIIFVITVLFCVVARFFLQKKKVQIEVTIYDLARWYLAGIGSLFAFFAGYQIAVKKIFGTELVDLLLMMFGVVVILSSVLYSLWLFDEKKIRIAIKALGSKFAVYLQSVFFCMAILACISFVNAGSNYAQGLATREMAIWIAAVMIVPYLLKLGKNKILLVMTGLYLVMGIIVGYLYLQPFLGKGEAYETALRSVILIIVWSYFLIRLIAQLALEKVQMSWTYTGMLLAFFICLIVFRQTTLWELAVVIPFGSFYLWNALQKKSEQVLYAIANGVILSFLVVTIDALLHRPFHYYIYIRYAGVFTTVTVASVYLALVFTVITVRLFVAYEQGKEKLAGCWLELVLLGIASAYQFLTLSRTGIMTCAGVYFVACVLYAVIQKKRRILPVLKLTIIVIVAVIAFLPTTFAATRMIPALSDNPTIYEIEVFQDSIKKGEATNSARYITIERFMGLSSERILGKTEQSNQDINTEEETVEQSEIIREEVASETGSSEVTVENRVTTEDLQVSSVSDNQTTETGSGFDSSIPEDYSNGRITIFKQYLKNLTIEGHPAVGLTLEDGSTIIHSHNSFLQMAYDGGILTGFIFLVLYVMLGIRTIKYFIYRYKQDNYALLPVLVFAAFGIASMVEYVFRPTIPLGFVFLAVIAPLLTNFETKNEKIKK